MSPPLVVVGAGLSGLCVALAAAPRPVLLVSRGRDGHESASALAQGGIAAALAPGDRPSLHAADTLAAGSGHNDPGIVDTLVNAAPAAVAWLAAQGVPFDRDRHGWQLGREGGHGVARIVHARGDASGREIVATLARAVSSAPHVQWLHGHSLTAIGLGADGVAGLRLQGPDGLTVERQALDLVLATGGIGALFAATTNPPGADGAGLALALDAGARGRDLEFIQCHPTALAVPGDGPLPLLTEALRGAGAVLRDGYGHALMAGHHPMADLAPRDVVARAVWRQRRGGGEAWLDMTALDERALAGFPGARALCRAHGIDPRRDWAPVTPAVHFHMGGIAVDGLGRSSIAGLHAVGEVACTGAHGANRLASNSLLECVVFGRSLGARLARPRMAAGPVARWVSAGAGAKPEGLHALRGLLWAGLGPVRDDAGLRAANSGIAALPALADTWQARLALRLLDAARARPVSLGAHHRADAA